MAAQRNPVRVLEQNKCKGPNTLKHHIFKGYRIPFLFKITKFKCNDNDGQGKACEKLDSILLTYELLLCEPGT